MAEEIVIRLSAEGNATVQIGKVEKSLGDLENQVKKTGLSFKNIFETAIGVSVANAFKAASSAAINFAETLVGDSIKAAIQQEDAIAKMNNALALSGEFTTEASQEFIAFSEALQANSKFADDVILGQLALAKTFGATNEQAKRLVEAAVDLSTATGVDLETAVRSLGGSLQGVSGQLGKTIPGIKELTQEQLKAGEAIDLVASRFSGSGKNALLTFSGAITQAKNTFGDLQEELGGVFTSNATLIAVISAVSKEIQSLTGLISKESFADLLSQGIKFAISGIQELVTVIQFVSPFFQILGQAVKATGEIILNVFKTIFDSGKALGEALLKILSGDFKGAVEALSSGVADAIDKGIGDSVETVSTLGREFGKTTPILGDVQDALKRVENAAAAGAKSQNDLNKSLEDQSKAAKKAATDINALAKEQEQLAGEGAALAQSLGFTGKESPRAAQLKLETQELQVQRDAQLITDEEFFARQAELRQQQFDLENEQLKASLDKKTIDQATFDNSTLANQQKFASDLNNISKARTKFEDDQAKQRAQNTRDSLNTIATLQTSSSKTLFRIGQAAAFATATIDGIAAIQKALAVGPPLSFFLVPAVAAAQAANLAKIASAKPPGLAGGIDEVPQGFQNDTFPAMLTSGERVVPAKTNEDLKSFLIENQGTNSLLSQLIDAVRSSGNVMVNVGGETITNVVRRELESGGTLAVEA